MMNQSIKAKWVTALRSGNYIQTVGHLNHNGAYCCLGVLCEVSDMDTGFGIGDNLEQLGGAELIGNTIQHWAGLDLPNGANVTIDGEIHTLSHHNDHGKTFTQIADAIEAQL